MTTDKLPNFCRADEAMRVAEGFFEKAADACLRNSHAAQDMVDRMFLAHAAQTLRDLAKAMADQRQGPDSNAHQTFVQYAPSEPVPGDEALERLQQHGHDATGALELLNESARSWVTIFEHFQSAADTEREAELHAACWHLIDRWRRQLSEAHQQRGNL